jgi:hypothetical protein
MSRPGPKAFTRPKQSVVLPIAEIGLTALAMIPAGTKGSRHHLANPGADLCSADKQVYVRSSDSSRCSTGL